MNDSSHNYYIMQLVHTVRGAIQKRMLHLYCPHIYIVLKCMYSRGVQAQKRRVHGVYHVHSLATMCAVGIQGANHTRHAYD